MNFGDLSTRFSISVHHDLLNRVPPPPQLEDVADRERLGKEEEIRNYQRKEQQMMDLELELQVKHVTFFPIISRLLEEPHYC